MKYEIDNEIYNNLVELGYKGQSGNIFDISIWLFEEKQVVINTPRVEKLFNEGWGYQVEIYYPKKYYPSVYGYIGDTPFEALKFGIERYVDTINNNDINLNSAKWRNLLSELED